MRQSPLHRWIEEAEARKAWQEDLLRQIAVATRRPKRHAMALLGLQLSLGLLALAKVFVSTLGRARKLEWHRSRLRPQFTATSWTRRRDRVGPARPSIERKSNRASAD